MSGLRQMLKDELKQLLFKHHDLAYAHPWYSEARRWTELLICLAHQVSPRTPIEKVRESVDLLLWAELLHPDTLAQPSADQSEAIKTALCGHDVAPEDADRILDVWEVVARRVNGAFEGHIQILLRRHAMAARDELIATLGDSGLAQDELMFAVTHWLQNVANAPLGLANAHKARFLKTHDASDHDFEGAADEIGVNVSAFDDLIAADEERG